MSRSTAFVSVALVMFAATPLFAQQPAPRGAAASATAMATVEAINQTTREVTLKKEDGELVTLVVSEEARNLSQVEKGDRVVVTYEVGLVVALGAPGTTPARVEETEVGRAPLGARPGGSIKQTTAVTATVVGIDPKARKVTLKGPQRTVELAVADDLDLSKIKIGDSVGAVYQESLALVVEPAPR
jgi:Cu/Ag efflux protein CusF